MPTLTNNSDLCDFLYALYNDQYDFIEMHTRHYDKDNLREEVVDQWKKNFYTDDHYDTDKTYNWFMNILEDQFVLISNKVLRKCLLTTVKNLISTNIKEKIVEHIDVEEACNAPL